MVRVRIAPSPTGYPHIGTIYQALFDYAFAKKNQGKFFIRIEDTDRARFVSDAEEKIYSALDWFGLQEDESPRKGGPCGPYRQSERLDIYKKYAEELIQKGGAYYCFCTKERLQELHQKQQSSKKPTMYDKHCRTLSRNEIEKKLQHNERYVIRLKIPEHTTLIVRDEIRGDIQFQSDLIEDTVLLKADGYPTYHLANVIDDHFMETSHVVRGEEWLPSLPKHVLVYDYFDWKKPLFFHTPVLRNPDKSKLSKRQGHTSITFYKEEGYLPQAILNYLALMAWSHPEQKEIFSLDEFTRLMDLKDIKPVGPIFDIKKLEWMNGIYIRTMDIHTLIDVIKKYEREIAKRSYLVNDVDEVTFKKIVTLAQSRISTLREFYSLVRHFYEEPVYDIRLNKIDRDIAKDLQSRLESMQNWNKENILSALRDSLKAYNIKMNVLYKILTGQDRGLPLPESLEILGKEKTLQRLQQ